MDSSVRVCPNCTSPMQIFLAREVELHRCMSCGGFWFESGALEKATGQESLPREPLEGSTTRRCAFCRSTLDLALLPGPIPVETCGACGGVYLDEHELEEVAGGRVPLTAKEKNAWKTQAATEQPGFVCIRCGKRFPLAQGNAVRNGLACPACTPQSHPGKQAKPGELASADTTQSPWPDDFGDLVGLIDRLWSMFHH